MEVSEFISDSRGGEILPRRAKMLTATFCGIISNDHLIIFKFIKIYQPEQPAARSPGNQTTPTRSVD